MGRPGRGHVGPAHATPPAGAGGNMNSVLLLPDDGDAPISHETTTVGSRGRIYTSASQRSRLGLDGYGHGERLAVGVVSVSNADGLTALPSESVAYRAVAFTVRLQEYGEFTVPVPVREYLDIAEGDVVRWSAQRT